MKAKINKGFISIILVVAVTIVVTTIGIANMPLGVLGIFSKLNLSGTSITAIDSSTKITDLAIILPNNFDSLNDNKIEISTTTLPLLTGVGALSSGSLTTGFTAVPVALGGTGTTSPTSGRVMLGNGSQGLTVASSTGTSGQFFTSGGAGAYPNWTTSAVNQADDYNWTGTNLFTDLQASSTLTINGVALSFPANQGATSTALLNDGSGNLSWGVSGWKVLVSTTTTVALNIATTTFTASQADEIKMILNIPSMSEDGSTWVALTFNDDTVLADTDNYSYHTLQYTSSEQVASSTSADEMEFMQYAVSTGMYFVFDIHNETSNNKLITWTGTMGDLRVARGSGMWRNTSEQIDTIRIQMKASQTISAGTKITILGIDY